MAKFVYSNIKNVNMDYILFEFYCEYYPCVTIEKKADPYLKS